MEVILSIVIGLVTGIISGVVSGYMVSNYFRWKDKVEKEEENKFELRNKITDYLNMMTTETLLLRDGKIKSKYKLQQLIMNRDNFVNAETKYLYKTIKGKDYFEDVLNCYHKIKKEINRDNSDYEKICNLLNDISNIELKIQFAEMECSTCKNKRKCMKKGKCISNKEDVTDSINTTKS